MKIYDIAIVGSGIGGSLIGALKNKTNSVILFEKDSNVGGCAGTFNRANNFYNVGATTFVGYEEGHIVKKIFDKIEYKPKKLKQTTPAIRVLFNNHKIDRIENFEEFLKEIDKLFPNKNNRLFWEKIFNIDKAFWELKNIYFAKYSLKSYLNSFISFLKLLHKFKSSFFISADRFIQNSLGEISLEYRAFLDEQLRITLQSTTKEVSLLTMALGLSYPFHKTFYSLGGMGNIIEEILEEVNIRKKEAVKSIEKEKDYFLVKTKKGDYYAKNIVLNSTIFNSSSLFKDKKIQNYFDSFKFSNQSAFVVYLKVKSNKEFKHHYQIIEKNQIPNSISSSFFVSFSDKKDLKLSSKEYYSITISTHTEALFWKMNSKENYNKKKKETQEYILNSFLENFKEIKKEDIEEIFSATSSTFNRYIGRYNCGGTPFKIKNILNMPSVTTPFKGIYQIGDTVFGGQGWPGIAIGVNVLDKELK